MSTELFAFWEAFTGITVASLPALRQLFVGLKIRRKESKNASSEGSYVLDRFSRSGVVSLGRPPPRIDSDTESQNNLVSDDGQIKMTTDIHINKELRNSKSIDRTWGGPGQAL